VYQEVGMIHVFIGTKAQFIKTMPVIKELDRRNIKYNFIDSGQHAEISNQIRISFRLRSPDVYLRKQKKDITSIKQMVLWALKYFYLGSFRRKRIFDEIFKGKKGICLIHGDTLSTLLSMFLAKRAGIAVAHIEAGLRSYNIFHPFPEELIRIITMKFADVLFAPSEWAVDNLKKLRIREEIVNIEANTILDSLRNVRKSEDKGHDNHVLVTIHRFETIFSKKRLKFVLDVIDELSKKFKVIFVIHKPTLSRLKKWNMDHFLERGNIIPLELQKYDEFIKLMRKAMFVVTDGGSIQEECFYLNIPCLIMRKATERREGLGSNAYLSEFDKGRIDYFIENWQQFKVENKFKELSPSQKIVNYIERYKY
jgi:UDP-N-acetylglucosamine 2-epimerase